MPDITPRKFFFLADGSGPGSHPFPALVAERFSLSLVIYISAGVCEISFTAVLHLRTGRKKSGQVLMRGEANTESAAFPLPTGAFSPCGLRCHGGRGNCPVGP